MKLAAEEYLRIGVDQGWFSATVLRMGNPYGVLLPAQRLQGFIGVAMRQLLEGRPVRVFGDLDNVRDYVHLDDVFRAFDAASVRRREGFAVYNIGSGSGASVRDVLDALGRVTGRLIEVDRVQPLGDAARLPQWVVLECALALAELGWRAETTLDEGLVRMWREVGRS